jgi:ribosomal protein L11 methyltransferase
MSRAVPVLDIVFPLDHVPDLFDSVSTALHDLAPAAVQELEENGAPVWRVFFGSTDVRASAEALLVQQFGARGVTLAASTVPDDDWAARSQAALTHVRVGAVVVAPPWDVPSTGADDTLVIIKPSMGFGTGHHETTRLCLALLQEVDCRGRDVIDVGTGSGVLGIAAAKRGARHLVALDNDADAIACAVENFALNAVVGSDSSRHVHVTLGTLEEPRPPAHIVLANLTGAALTRYASHLVSQTAPDGCLILSGFLEQEANAVLQAFADRTRCEALRSEGGWCGALLKRRWTQSQLPPKIQEHRQRNESRGIRSQRSITEGDEPHSSRGGFSDLSFRPPAFGPDEHGDAGPPRESGQSADFGVPCSCSRLDQQDGDRTGARTYSHRLHTRC